MNRRSLIKISVLVLAVQLVLAGAAWGQSGDLEKAKRLNQQVNQLYHQGRYAEAIPLAKEALAILEKALGPEHPDVATSLNNLAELYRAIGSYAQAEPLLKRALGIFEKFLGPEHPDLATSLNNLALLYYSMGLYAQAEPLYKRALAIVDKSLGPEHPDLASSLNNLANLYHAMGAYARAEPLYKRALTIREKSLGPEHPDVAQCMNNLAALYQIMGSYARAESLFKHALAIFEKSLGTEHQEVATGLNNLANLYKDMGLYTQAEPLFKRSLAIFEKSLGPEHPNVATSLNNLAELYRDMGLYTQADPLYKRALAIREKALGPEHPDVAQSLNNLSLLYEAMESYAQAEPLNKRALGILEKALGPGHPNVAVSLNNLAGLYQAMGSYAQAEPLLKRALAIVEKALGPEHPSVAGSLNSLADFYRSIGSYTQAEQLFKRALTIRENVLGFEHPDVASSLNSLAALYDSMRSYAQAEPLYKRALAIWEKALGPEHPSVAASLNNLAGLYQSMGSYAQAETLYKRALGIFENTFGPEHPEVARSLIGLALLYYSIGSYAQAEPLNKRSLAIFEKVLGPEHPDVAISLHNLAGLFAALDRQPEALALFQRAQAIDLKVIDQILGFTSEEQALQFLATRQAHLEIALSLVSGSLIQDPAARRMACDWWLRRKGVLLEARKQFQEALIYSDDPEAIRTFQDLSRVRSRLSQLLFSGPGKEGPEVYKKRIAEIEAEKEKLEARLSRLSQAFARQQKKRRADAVQVAQALPQGTVLVDFARIRHANFKAKGKESLWLPAHYLAFVLRAGDGDKVGLIDLGQAEPIDKAVAEFKKAVADTSDLKGAGASAAGRRLYDLIFARLKSELGGSKEVFIAPDGQLNLIPFEVLQSPDGRWLIEDYTFNYLASGRDLVGSEKITAQAGDPVLLGDPDFDLGETAREQSLTRLGLHREKPEQTARRSIEMRGLNFSRLPGTRQEVEALGKVLGRAKVFTDRLALEEALTALRTSPRILHLATHGFFLSDVEWQALADSRGLMTASRPQPPKAHIENPLVRSGLALAGANQALQSSDPGQSDGLFTAEKVLGLRLRGTELVVLSACQTGTGEVKNGEGVYGLRRAFTQAGAQGIVMSLWSVPDLETKELMVEFYQNLQSGKLNRCQALRQAALSQMQIVKKRYGHANPLFWGAFVFLGQP